MELTKYFVFANANNSRTNPRYSGATVGAVDSLALHRHEDGSTTLGHMSQSEEEPRPRFTPLTTFPPYTEGSKFVYRNTAEATVHDTNAAWQHMSISDLLHRWALQHGTSR